MAGLMCSDGEFVYYDFYGPPPRSARLWFLDRDVRTFVDLVRVGLIDGYRNDLGVWTITVPDFSLENLAGVILRHEDADGTVIVWRLTDDTVPCHGPSGGAPRTAPPNWRLGVWPD